VKKIPKFGRIWRTSREATRQADNSNIWRYAVSISEGAHLWKTFRHNPEQIVSRLVSCSIYKVWIAASSREDNWLQMASYLLIDEQIMEQVSLIIWWSNEACESSVAWSKWEILPEVVGAAQVGVQTLVDYTLHRPIDSEFEESIFPSSNVRKLI